MKVLFRVDADSHMGIGHLMRCQALAQLLGSQQIDTVFSLRQQAIAIARDRHDWIGQIILIPDDISSDTEIDWLAQHCGLSEWDFVVLDGYQFSNDYRQKLHQSVNKLVLFDDNNNSGQLYADMVINSADHASQLNYAETAAQAIHCLGSGYRILRQEFYLQPPVTWSQRHSLTIMLGGSDTLNLTLPILQGLQVKAKDIPVRVITGAAYPYLESLQTYIRRSTQSIQHIHNCQQMAEMMSYSRLVVSAAGGSQFELLACHTPAILLIVAENQRSATELAAQQGWCEIVDCAGQIETDAIVNQMVDLWHDGNRLQSMHKHAQQLSSRDEGADNLLDAIERMLVDD
ncbi:UDP-2,4-diacetamido-2,4,6-trideoxy-beta-L-altropyranose hydrolase [Neptunicella sp.]|uniref:UDP-2,4-diacetamido-2,4, 6-trideoxy-beta-L-altropyranose hydrolase n=1 Tax=Neptunicella sp. TaxID=2125986 RepID=UPI003F690D82